MLEWKRQVREGGGAGELRTKVLESQGDVENWKTEECSSKGEWGGVAVEIQVFGVAMRPGAKTRNSEEAAPSLNFLKVCPG